MTEECKSPMVLVTNDSSQIIENEHLNPLSTPSEELSSVIKDESVLNDSSAQPIEIEGVDPAPTKKVTISTKEGSTSSSNRDVEDMGGSKDDEDLEVQLPAIGKKRKSQSGSMTQSDKGEGCAREVSVERATDFEASVVVHKKFRKDKVPAVVTSSNHHSNWWTSAAVVNREKDLTLEQFTDIVLASEGMSAGKHSLTPEGEHKAMVANIMNNKDLTVEVKPAAKVKPVVLSPRYPNGYNAYRYKHPKYKGHTYTRETTEGQALHRAGNPSDFNGTAGLHSVSVQPRVLNQRAGSGGGGGGGGSHGDSSGEAEDSRRPSPNGLPRLPRPPNVKKMVDDWMNHRCAPDAPPANPDCPDGMEDEVPAVKAKPKKFQLPLRGSAGRSASCVDPNNLALNLSTKCSSTTAESDSAFNSSPPLNNNNNSMKNGTAAASERVILDRLRNDRMDLTPTTVVLNCSSTRTSGLQRATAISHRPPGSTVPATVGVTVGSAAAKAGRLSPPRLEITRVSHPLTPLAPMHRHHHHQQRVVPAEVSNTKMQHSEHSQIRANAIKDLNWAHVKDMHGNLPIHNSVLMRKVDLVKRYCCVLQILDSSVDLSNEEKLTPMHLAVRNNSVEIVEVLLAFGADPLRTDSRGNTCLHIAVEFRAWETLRTILEIAVKHTDDVDVRNSSGVTSLQLAMAIDDRKAVDLLLKHGADHNRIKNEALLPSSN